MLLSATTLLLLSVAQATQVTILGTTVRLDVPAGFVKMPQSVIDSKYSYVFRPIPVYPEEHRIYVHLPEHVLFPTPVGRIEPANTAGFNRNPYHAAATRPAPCIPPLGRTGR